MTHSFMMVSAALGPPLMGWMLDFGFAVSTIMLGTAAYVLIAIVLLQPALTGPRARGEPG